MVFNSIVKLLKIYAEYSLNSLNGQNESLSFTREQMYGGIVLIQINRLEKVEIKQNRYKNLRDFYHNYLRWAIMLLLLSFACKNTFMGNILED